MHVGLNPALLSDLTKHIWLAHINQTCFSWLFLSLLSSPSLSLSDRTDQWISFCVLLWSATLFYLPGLCHAHFHSALLGCSELWESCVALALGQQVGKALLGFSYWLPTLSLKAPLWKLPRPQRVGQLYHFCSHFYTSYLWWIIEGLISLLKESGMAEEAESSVWTLIMSNAWANNMPSMVEDSTEVIATGNIISCNLTKWTLNNNGLLIPSLILESIRHKISILLTTFIKKWSALVVPCTTLKALSHDSGPGLLCILQYINFDLHVTKLFYYFTAYSFEKNI